MQLIADLSLKEKRALAMLSARKGESIKTSDIAAAMKVECWIATAQLHALAKKIDAADIPYRLERAEAGMKRKLGWRLAKRELEEAHADDVIDERRDKALAEIYKLPKEKLKN